MSGTRKTEATEGSPFPIPDHQLLRRIGGGSYGEVWLARSATGAFRAVKIVHRRAFDNHRPYDREFEGLKNFEPVSRDHDGLVDILHVGRGPDGDSFYCVMELADNAIRSEEAIANNDPHWLCYQPLTLETLIRQQGRVPVKDCVTIAIAVARALRHLHETGLVHRDIKPSNIIFVGGAPKLADVGLVARTDSTRTFVGTEGFLPPEGPGTPQADIYSLGKCLYEMAMGKDRLAFPSPPTQLEELPDRMELLELNEIINRACDPEPRRRYPSAAELLNDLQVLASGRSLKAVRARQRRFKWMATFLGVLTLAGAIWFVARLTSQPQLRSVRQFPMPGGWPVGIVTFGDFDGDGETDLACGGRNDLRVISSAGETLFQDKLPGFDGDWIFVQGALDTDGNGKDELLAGWTAATNCVLSLCEPRRNEFGELKRFTASGALRQGNSGPVGDTELVFHRYLQPPDFKRKVLLASVRTGYRLQPRLLRAYDLDTAKPLWDAPLADSVIDVQTADLDGDGESELLVGTYAPNNGLSLAESDDMHSRLYAFTSDGRRLWSVTAGGIFSQALSRPVRSGSTNIIYALVRRTEDPLVRVNNNVRPEGRVLKLAFDGAELARYETTGDLRSFAVSAADRNGRVRVLAADSQGCLHELDGDLRLLRKVPVAPRTHSWTEMFIEGVVDLDGDGRQEIVVRSAQVEFISGLNQGRPGGEPNIRRAHDNCLHVFDENLRLLARHDIAPRLMANGSLQMTIIPPRPDGKRQIAVVTDQAVFIELSR